jgi:hypothetical protein
MALLGRNGGAQEHPAEATTAPASKQSLAPASGAPGQPGAQAGEEQGRGSRFDATNCWRELDRFNQEVTLDTFRDWSVPLLASGDALVRDYLRERLTELVGNDAGRALQVLDWSREAQGKSFGMYLMAVRDSEAVHQPQVSSKLLEMGLDPSIPSERRAGLLSALDTQKRLKPAALDQLTAFAKDPGSGEAGWAAARTIARVMKRDFKQNGDASAYMDKLLTIGLESPDEQIRYLGQMMPMHISPVLDAESTERYAKILATEGDPDGRGAAAHNLAVSEDKQKVLELFAKSFETEQSECVKWALFRFSARAAGTAALPVMANMAMQDTRFQPLYRDFEQIYASGTLDFVRVWNSLPNQDPFNCLDRHE